MKNEVSRHPGTSGIDTHCFPLGLTADAVDLELSQISSSNA